MTMPPGNLIGGNLVTPDTSSVSAQAEIAQNLLPPPLSYVVQAKELGVVWDNVTDDSAAVQRAITACQARGGGRVILPPGPGKFIASGVLLTRDVVLTGAAGNSTIINWNGNGAAIAYLPTGAFNPGFHAIEGISIVGGSNANAIGVEISDTFGFRLANGGISGFTNGRGLVLHNRNWWTEGTVFDNFRIGNNKINVSLERDPAPAAATDSFGYTRVINCSLDVRANQTGLLVGNDAISTLPARLYNSILNFNIWLSGDNPVGIAFGTNGTIVDGNGLLNGEGTTGTGGVMVQPNTLTAGFRNSDVFARSSALNQTETPASLFRDFRYRKFRDLSEQRNGQGTTPQWFKVAKIGATRSSFMGRVTTQSQRGAAAYRSATCDFSFGVDGNGTGGFVPQFSVIGEGFNGTGNYASRFKLAIDGTDYYLFYLRPSFQDVCLFEYSYDWAGAGTIELWQSSSDPSTIGGMTVVYDSFNNAAQQMFNGDEQVFVGQRSTFTTNGGATNYQVAHNLGATPEHFFAVAMSADATSAEISSVTADATNITITMKTITPAGTGNIRFAVEYSRKKYQKQFRPT